MNSVTDYYVIQICIVFYNWLVADGWDDFKEDFLDKENKLQSIKLGLTDPRETEEKEFEEDDDLED